MHLLPTGLAKLADMADKHDSSRFALANIHLRVHGDNTFVAEATDTKALLRVSGPCPSEPGSYPTSLLPGFDEAPNGHTDALVPASKWQKLFAAAGKLTRGKALNSQPVLRSVAVRVSEKVTTFGATDASQKLVETVENSPGRFPPAADILCSARRHADRVIAFDPRQLANLLHTMDAIIDDPDARVEFHIPKKPEHPMLVTGAMALIRPDNFVILDASTGGFVDCVRLSMSGLVATDGHRNGEHHASLGGERIANGGHW